MDAPSMYRRNCLEEHGERCELCNATEDIIAHHIDGDRENNDLDNLAPVCRSCHGKIHAGCKGYEWWTDQLLEIEGRRVARTLYAGDEVLTEVDIKYEELSPRYRRQHGEKLSKNDAFYPALLRAGLYGTSIESELELEEDS